MIKELVVAQVGARMHYAIPIILHRAGMLSHFFTDICATKGIGKLVRMLPYNKLPASFKRLHGRVPQGIPHNKISTFEGLGLWYSLARSRAKDFPELSKAHLLCAQNFTRSVIQHGFKNADGVYAFNGAGLELLQKAKKNGMRSIMEQTQAPISIWNNLMSEEQTRYPEWERFELDNPYRNEMDRRIQEEWRLSDTILVGSEYVRECIRSVGGPAERCVVVPYGVDSNLFDFRRYPPSGRLKVLTVGAVNLNKGSPYVSQAARKLRGKAVFRMAGGIQILEKAHKELSEKVELIGLVPRSEIHQHYAWADVFLLPSICEGSATVVYEALAAGLPVICTPNTGSVVRDGIEGSIVPIRTVDSIVEAIVKLKESPSLWQEMSQAARARSREFTLENYRERFLAAIDRPPESQRS
jgi:hypothetical protein